MYIVVVIIISLQAEADCESSMIHITYLPILIHKMYSYIAYQTCGVTFYLKLNFKTGNERVHCTIYASRFGISVNVDKVTFESRPITAHGNAVAAFHTIPRQRPN